MLSLVGAGTALAASGVGSLVTNGEDGAVTARGAQQPLGSLSATPPVDTNTVAGDRGAGNPGVANDGEVVGKAIGNPGSGNSGLPFTGFLAIPLLILGAAMLLGGVALRRRSPQLA